jgi:hypothetical protein
MADEENEIVKYTLEEAKVEAEEEEIKQEGEEPPPPEFMEVPVIRGGQEIGNLLSIVEKVGEGKAHVCGGHARWMCSPKYSPTPSQDVDVYCEEEGVFEKMKEHLRTMNMKELENPMSLLFRIDKEDYDHPFFALPPIQLIKPMKVARIVTVGSLAEVLRNFDFTVIRIGLIDQKHALADGEFIHHELTNQLRIKNIHCPISSSFRFMKYYKKGYFPKMTEIVKLFKDWDDRDQSYRTNLLALIEKKEELTETEIMDLEALMRID